MGARNSNTREFPTPLETSRKICSGCKAGFHAEHHRFGARHIVDRDQEVGDIFHPAAVAEGAEIVRRARKIREQSGFSLRIAARSPLA